MNYTGSCGLPQWEKSDRVMMEDFNQMCADIDRELACAKHTRVRLEKLSRDAYRQEVQARVQHGRGGLTDSMWVNALETREAAGGDGHGWNGQYGVSFGPGSLPTLAGIKKTAVEIAHVNNNSLTEPMSDLATVEFISDGYGVLEEVMIWSLMHASGGGNEYEYTITLKRMDTNAVVAQAGPFLTVSGRGSVNSAMQEVNFPLEANVRYRMSFAKPENAGFNGESGFMLAAKFNSPAEMLTFAAREAERVIGAQAAVTENRGATALVRWSGEGSFALSAGGAVAGEAQTRDGINALGEPCKETELALPPVPAGETEVRIETTSGAGDFILFDYGLIWK